MSENRIIPLQAPFSRDIIANLRAGDAVLLSGTIYTARDAAHKRLTDALAAGEELPLSLQGQVIYYAGPSPAPPGRVAGAIGPTTSCRMDAFAPALVAAGLLGMIGKGTRSLQVAEACMEHGAIYLAAVGGAAALLSETVLSMEVVAYEDLGTEAIRRLKVRDMPLFVALDTCGGDIYREGRERYRR